MDTHHVGLIRVRVYTPDAVPDLVAASSLEPSAACTAICSLTILSVLLQTSCQKCSKHHFCPGELTFGVYLMAMLKRPAEQLPLS